MTDAEIEAAIANAPVRKVVRGFSGRMYRIVARRYRWKGGVKAEGYRIIREADGVDMCASQLKLKTAVRWVQSRG